MGDKEFFTGINYWGSEKGINMWSEFNEESVENDMKLLKEAGITHLRVFPLWSVFQPLKALYGPYTVYEYGFGEDILPDTMAGKAGVSEEACEKFKKFCDLAKKYDMKLIVAMICGHMSFRTYNPPAFDGKSLLTDATVIKWQIRFIKYFVERFKSEDVIMAWDLGNETVHMPRLTGKGADDFYLWCSTISNAIKSKDNTRPVISGLDKFDIYGGYININDMADYCDINTVHPYNIFSTSDDPVNTMKPILDLTFRCCLSESIAKIPTFVEEFASIGYMNCSEKTEADFYRAAVLACFTHSTMGTMWWCSFDQGHFDYAPYRWNSIGSNYGFFDKNLNKKKIAYENLKLKEYLKKFNNKLPKHTINGAIMVETECNEKGIENLRASYILAKQANLDIEFWYAKNPVPDYPLYIIPSVQGNKSLPKHRFDELMKKVENGAVLYICADVGLMREIPDITGVNIAYREGINSRKTMMFEGNEISINTKYAYKAESVTAKILAIDENGEPVFFCSNYGKGYVFFLTLPLERHLAEEQGVFYKHRDKRYDLVYRCLAKCAKIERICDSDNPYIRTTEHRIDDESFYVSLINYNNKKESAEITLNPKYEISDTYGKTIENNVIELSENDGMVLEVKRRQS